MSNWCIVYLASPKNFTIAPFEPDRPRIDVLNSSIIIANRVFPDIDIIVFHEDYSDCEFDQLPGVKHFVKVDFESNTEEFVKHYGNKGYMMMCRFFSGIMQNEPILQKYTHYMRLDDDSYFLKPYPGKHEVKMFNTSDYVYRSLFIDKKDHQQLFEYTVDHLKKWNLNIGKIYHQLKDIDFLDSANQYTGLSPYNNFHTSSLALWKHPLISSFVDSLEKDKCILKYGWMDANIHAMIVWVLAPFANVYVQHCGTFGYRHNFHVSPLHSTGIQYDSKLSFIENP